MATKGRKSRSDVPVPVSGEMYRNTLNDFGSRLKKAMKGMSNNAFAKRCDMSERVIRNYLDGRTYPSLDRLAVLAEASGKTPEWFIRTENSDNSADAALRSILDSSGNYVSGNDRATPEQQSVWLALLDAMTPEERSQTLRHAQRHGVTSLIPYEQDESVKALSKLWKELDAESQQELLTLLEVKAAEVLLKTNRKKPA